MFELNSHTICIIAIIVVTVGGLVFTQIRSAVRLRDRIRQIYPDAEIGSIEFNTLKFTYKGFQSSLFWESRDKYTTGSTMFRVMVPFQLRKEMSDAKFSMRIASPHHSHHEAIQQRCKIDQNAHLMMQGLVRDQAFLDAVDSISVCSDADIFLDDDFFWVRLLDKGLLEPESLAKFAMRTAIIFDRVIAAASAVNPVILSMPPIAGNFVINPNEFVHKCSDEDMYDALDNSSDASADSSDDSQNQPAKNVLEESAAADNALASADDNELNGQDQLKLLSSADSFETEPLAAEAHKKLPPPPPLRKETEREEQNEDESKLFF